MEVIGTDECPKCKKERTIYSNDTAYCESCNSHFDVGMKNER